MKPDHEGARIPTGIKRLGEAYGSGTLTPVGVTKEYLSRIEALNPRLNCFITILGDSALKAAADSERRYMAGHPVGPLDGVPIAIKDLVYIEGVKCTAGSRILADNVAPYDAHVVRKLKAAGAVLLGTTNLHEFAAGVTSVNPHYGPVRNPWDEERIAGGSSGGSAAAVAAGMAAGAIGTDTGGSVRIPAALCGVLGLKPTYGRVSRLGVVPLASSFDTVGVLARSARDAGLLLAVVAGHEKEDLTTVEAEAADYVQALTAPLASPRVGVVRNYFFDNVDPAVEANFDSFVSRLRELGCAVSDVSLDWVQGAFERWLPIRGAEATAFHLKWFESAPELYGEDVRALLEQGRGVSGVDYVAAVNARPSFMERFADTMREFDFLAVPCTAVPAPRLDQATVHVKGKDQSVRAALIKPSIPFNYIGAPVASVPSGFAAGLPLGVQLAGRLFDEAGVLRLAHAYEAKFGPYPMPALWGQLPATA